MLVVSLLILALLFLEAPRQRGSVLTSINHGAKGNTSVAPISATVPRARLYVLVDNNPWDSLKTGWGLSVFVETPHGNVLFDTGPSPDILAYNAERLGINLCNVSAVVISHEHMDHVGGLPYIARHCPYIPVYVPSGTSKQVLSWMRSLGLRGIRIINTTTMIIPGIYVLSPLWGPPSEESLVINTSRGLVVLVGCSHPGIARIVRHAKRVLGDKILLVMGGFHLAWTPRSKVEKVASELVGLGVRYIAPIHCSGSLIRSLLASRYPRHYIGAHVGTVIEIGGSCNGVCVH